MNEAGFIMILPVIWREISLSVNLGVFLIFLSIMSVGPAKILLTTSVVENPDFNKSDTDWGKEHNPPTASQKNLKGKI